MPPAELDAGLLGYLCGVWADEDNSVWVSCANPQGTRTEQKLSYRPFAWIVPPATPVHIEGLQLETLRGEGVFSALAHADVPGALDALEDSVGKGSFDEVKPAESQFLLQNRARLFADIPFFKLRRCQLDIETSSADGSFSDPSRPDDRVLAVGLRQGGENRFLVLEQHDDASEKKLLQDFTRTLLDLDPDIVEGHNLFKFDLDFLRQRCKRHGLPCNWGRFGRKATFRNSRLKVAERWVDFPRCDMPGRAVVDTYLLVQLWDISTRELASYGLKDVALHFGITSEEEDERTYIPGAEIQKVWGADRERFLRYLGDDLRETEGLADLLLPTYFEQTKTFPILLQEATLRGTTGKIDLLFLEEYYHARVACPVPPEVRPFEGGYTRSFHEGVFGHVLHFDVASLYPSILLSLGRNPRNDSQGVFIPLLRSLREYRLRFKQLARTAPSEEERAEAKARQANFKILINSFYGYLGFSGARFGDGELAAEVTRVGRELLQKLIDEFERQGCKILETDTDGIYLSSERYYTEPEALLALVQHILPKGIDLEHDGRYEAMFCYKAKNYALREGRRVLLKGSALRSRGIEPYLKRLSDAAIHHLLGLPADKPADLVAGYRQRIGSRQMPVAELAKAEVLSMNPEAYEKFIAEGGKPRRASAEASLQMTPRPRMGERISYYITPKSKGRTSDWQRARPVTLFDAAQAPYDPDYYLKKLDDWLERYGPFLGLDADNGQKELF